MTEKTATPIVCSNHLQSFMLMIVHWTKHANFYMYHMYTNIQTLGWIYVHKNDSTFPRSCSLWIQIHRITAMYLK